MGLADATKRELRHSSGLSPAAVRALDADPSLGAGLGAALGATPVENIPGHAHASPQVTIEFDAAVTDDSRVIDYGPVVGGKVSQLILQREGRYILTSQVQWLFPLAVNFDPAVDVIYSSIFYAAPDPDDAYNIIDAPERAYEFPDRGPNHLNQSCAVSVRVGPDGDFPAGSAIELHVGVTKETTAWCVLQASYVGDHYDGTHGRRLTP